PLAKIIKDLSAGAVFFSSVCAVVVGYLIFIKKGIIDIFGESVVMKRVASFPPHITIIVIFLVLFVSLFIKIVKEKTPSLIGGMPSIHTAIAFSLATLAYLLSSNLYVLFLSLILGGMVAQARITGNFHNLWEVIAGALLGSGITLFIFQVLV
ncbi:MAG: diacylglycerol kinase, partial [Elusimicrobiota bacterium]